MFRRSEAPDLPETPLLRARLARTLSAEELAFLYPEYPKDGSTTLADLCGELEALARAAALGMAPDLLDSIRAEHVRVCSALDIVRSER